MRKATPVRYWVAAAWVGMAAAIVAAADPTGAGPTRFAVVADSRGMATCANVLAEIKKLPGGAGSFLLTPGDMDPPETTRAQIDKVFGEKFAWSPVIGNHETDSPAGMKYLRDYFAKRLKDGVNPGPSGTEETSYSFDAGEAHIAVIDEYWNGRPRAGTPRSDADAPAARENGGGRALPALRDWLSTDLKKSPKPWKIVVGHEPAYPQEDVDWKTGRHAESSLNQYPADRDAFWKLLEDQGVAAYLCGHTHRYSRYQPKGSKVWQIDAAQARGDMDWKYDAFLIVTADERSLKFETYRNLKDRGKFALTDSLSLSKAPGAATQPATQPAAPLAAQPMRVGPPAK